jgi:hypothetical protein
LIRIATNSNTGDRTISPADAIKKSNMRFINAGAASPKAEFRNPKQFQNKKTQCRNNSVLDLVLGVI